MESPICFYMTNAWNAHFTQYDALRLYDRFDKRSASLKDAAAPNNFSLHHEIQEAEPVNPDPPIQPLQSSFDES